MFYIEKYWSWYDNFIADYLLLLVSDTSSPRGRAAVFNDASFSSFPICLHLILFSCLIALSRQKSGNYVTIRTNRP